MKDRILKIIREEQLTPARFADILGVQRSSISHYLSGRNNPGIDFIQKILIKFKYISSDWLITGKGEMYKHAAPGQILPLIPGDTKENIVDLGHSESKNTLPGPIENEILNHDSGNKVEISLKQVENKVLVEKIILYFSDRTFQEFFSSK